MHVYFVIHLYLRVVATLQKQERRGMKDNSCFSLRHKQIGFIFCRRRGLNNDHVKKENKIIIQKSKRLFFGHLRRLHNVIEFESINLFQEDNCFHFTCFNYIKKIKLTLLLVSPHLYIERIIWKTSGDITESH